MTIEPATPVRTVRLDFLHQDEMAHAREAVRRELSAVTLHGRSMWLANDELATVERLLLQPDGSFGQHRSYELADLFDLPEGPKGRMDIEGLEVDPTGPWLWLIGSHSLTRGKAKPGKHEPAEAIARLKEIRREANRHFLGRIPLVATDEAGTYELPADAPGPGGRIAHCPACLETAGALDRLLAEDEHIAPFLAIPAKENGFDIEGIAARGARVYIGLRGPVLGRWAVLLELEVEEVGPGALAPKRLDDRERRYRKHFLDLGGLGVRDFAFDGDSLLILAGPTMDLDGPQMVLRWPGGFEAEPDNVIAGDRLERVLVLPHSAGVDHAEGICLLEGKSGQKELLVVYDLPASHRLYEDERSIDADVFALES
jgi:hypothetical protein